MFPIHFVSNGAIALSYFWIGVVLLKLSSQLYRPGARRLYWVLATFILSCAVGHSLEAVRHPLSTSWHPITAIVSMASAVLIHKYQLPLANAAAADNLNETILGAMAQPLIVVRIDGEDLQVAYQNPAAIKTLERDMTGQLLGEALPGHKVVSGYQQRSMLTIYREVALDGVVAEFDTYYPSDGLEGWYRIKALPAGPRQALVAWADISEEHLGIEIEQMLIDVQQAILRREMVLHYQPIIDLSTGAIAGYEALIRWPRPDGTMRYPDEFLGIVERTELMASLCYLVAELACQELKSWDGTAREGLHMAINLSPLTVGQSDFESRFNSVLDNFAIERSQLQLEITELHALAASVLPKIKRLRQIGHRISIDDFGTGFSNVASLQSYPADQLKIDKGFISNLMNSPQDQEIVKAIIGLARLFGLATVAEGVEDAVTAEWLRKAGVDYGQGYHWGRAEAMGKNA